MESVYQECFTDNRAILDKAIDLNYTAGIIDSATIIFDVRDDLVTNNGSDYSAIDSELKDIKRYNVFKYYDDINMLLPLETYHDLENNKVYADVDELGTYCIMDLEQWFYDLGITPNEQNNTLSMSDAQNTQVGINQLDDLKTEEQEEIINKQDKISTDYIPLTQEELQAQIELLMQEDNLPNSLGRLTIPTDSTLQSVNRQVDLVFVVDTTGSMSGAINNVKTYMGTLVTSLYNQGITPYLAVVDYTDYRNYPSKSTITLTKKDGDVWAYNRDEAIQLINQLQIKNYGYDETPIDALEMGRRLNFRSGATKFMVLITDEGYYVNNRYDVSNLNQMAELLKNGGLGYYNSRDIITSVVTTSSLKNTYNVLNGTTNGTYFDIYSNFSPQLKDFIVSRIQNEKRFSIVSSVGLGTITLDSALTKGGNTDTDNDRLTDSEEVNWSMITITKDGFKLPTLQECMSKKKGYVINGLERVSWVIRSQVKDISILPILSDPTKKDSDGDGNSDAQDSRPLFYDLRKALVFQSDRPAGKNSDGTVAEDLKTNDYSKEQLLTLHPNFKYQIGESDTPDVLFSEFTIMSTFLFARGEMEDVIKDMIGHFKGGTGTDYYNDILAKNIKEHDSTQKYIKLVKEKVISELVKNGGNLNAIRLLSGNKNNSQIYKYIQNNAKYPRFDTPSDISGGLTICINDTWGNLIEVDDFIFDGKYFKGILRFNIYDHFGLDEPDMLPKSWWKNYGELAGFRAWFVLQHYDKFNSKYKSFITRMVVEVPFQGEIYTFESMGK